MRATTVYDCNIIELPKVRAASGNITAVNSEIELPFMIKRCYYLYDIPSGEARGGHGHKQLHQFIVAASGSFDLILFDGRVHRTIHLNRPNRGVYLPPGLWRELDNFSGGTICLVLASELYSEDDYIRDYNKFKQFKNI